MRRVDTCVRAQGACLRSAGAPQRGKCSKHRLHCLCHSCADSFIRQCLTTRWHTLEKAWRVRCCDGLMAAWGRCCILLYRQRCAQSLMTLQRIPISRVMAAHSWSGLRQNDKICSDWRQCTSSAEGCDCIVSDALPMAGVYQGMTHACFENSCTPHLHM